MLLFLTGDQEASRQQEIIRPVASLFTFKSCREAFRQQKILDPVAPLFIFRSKKPPDNLLLFCLPADQ
jgi:hypothetical protein